jgi:hypothetical protein
MEAPESGPRFGDPGTGDQEDAAMPPVTDAPSVSAASAIDAVRDRNERRLLALNGVVGVATGRTPTGEDAIVVYLREGSFESGIPRDVEGYPVQTVVSGEIDALGAT